MNIDRYRPIAAIVLIAFLALTNSAYLIAYLNSTTAEYSSKWDMPQLKVANLLLLGLLVGLAVIKPKLEEE